jgi:phosphoribosylformimino-5-aminoimidazole carboxamide ribotide isomerase
MQIIPAIDLKGGRCVRLRQGRAEEATVYAGDPAEVARRWADEGAGWLHVVDLDGAFGGKPTHLDALRAVCAACAAAGVPVEAGGGLRTDEDLRRVLDCGVARAIVGTRALAGREELRRLAGTFGARIAVGIDARDGWVQVRGWTDTTAVRATDLAREAAAAGVGTIICTDTAVDGMLVGPNAAAMDAMCAAAACDVVASGGIASAADVARLIGLGRANLAGAIVGKALYDGRVTLGELLRAAREEHA